MITFEQAKTLTEGQVVYIIKENKIKEARITSIHVFEASQKPPYSHASCRICYKVKGGTAEWIDWASERYSCAKLCLTKQEVAEYLVLELSHKMQKLEEQLSVHQQKINEAKKFGGLN